MVISMVSPAVTRKDRKGRKGRKAQRAQRAQRAQAARTALQELLRFSAAELASEKDLVVQVRHLLQAASSSRPSSSHHTGARQWEFVVFDPSTVENPRPRDKYPKKPSNKAQAAYDSVLQNSQCVEAYYQNTDERIVGSPIPSSSAYPWIADLIWLEAAGDKEVRWMKVFTGLLGLLILHYHFDRWSCAVPNVSGERQVRDLRATPSARDFATAHNIEYRLILLNLERARKLRRLVARVGVGILPFMAFFQLREVSSEQVDVLVTLLLRSEAVGQLATTYKVKVGDTMRTYQANRGMNVLSMETILGLSREDISYVEMHGMHDEHLLPKPH